VTYAEPAVRSVRGEAALEHVRPELAAVVAWLRGRPLPAGVVSWAVGHGPRDAAEQADALRRKVSKARFGESPHNWLLDGHALALDVYPIVVKQGRRVVSGSLSHYSTIGEAAAACGVEWGGTWASFPDRPHVQVRDWRLLRPADWRALAGLAEP